MDNDIPGNPLSDGQAESLRMENELLHLKIKAELGVETRNLRHPVPEIENKYLKQVLDFERKTAGAKKQKVYDLIGRPPFKKWDEMEDNDIETALGQLLKLLFKNNIEVLWRDLRDVRVKYRFVTEEIFEHEMHDASKDDFTAQFDYERFHPDHKKAMKKTAAGFLSAWFRQGFSENTSLLASRFMLPDRSTRTKKEVLARLRLIFDAYAFFANGEYEITNVTFKLKAGNDSGLGHVDGAVKYTAVLESGETAVFDDVFSLLMAYEDERWEVFYLIFPGFSF